MPCCMADEYGDWCKNEGTKPHEGNKDYCIFHDPKESKNWSKKIVIDEFNQKVFARIDEAIEKKEKCDLSGTIFPGDINFSEYNKDKPLPEIDFRRATFNGVAHFQQTTFSGEADFWGATFRDNAKFFNATFIGKATFRGTIFSSEAAFWGAIFSDEAAFALTKFKNDAKFNSVIFNKKLLFNSVTFKKLADFNDASFDGLINFYKTVFTNDTIFSNAIFSSADIANFKHAKFKGCTYFDNASFCSNIKFDYALFEKFANFNKAKLLLNASFMQVEFEKSAYFSNCEFNEIYFKGASAKDGFIVEGASLSDMTFDGIRIESFKFINCEWPEDTDGRKIVADEKDGTADTKQLEDIYRRLKKKAKEDHDEIMASAWHYKEKEMCRTNLFNEAKPYNEDDTILKKLFGLSKLSMLWWGLSIYKWISGYGEEPRKALNCLLYLWGISLLLLAAAMLCTTGISWTVSWKEVSDVLLAAIEYPLLITTPSFKLENCTLLKGVILIFTRLLMPLQAALLAFAIRNKFRR